MNALTLVHETVSKFVNRGDFVIDATAGRGYDTAFLASLVGEEGKVLAFDIQREAVESTRALLASRGLQNAEVVMTSHAEMSSYAAPETASCILFNLGYLPSGDHSIYTRAASTEAAVLAGLDILKKGGLMCVTVYSGGDSGYEERDALLPFFAALDDNRYQVLQVSFANWKKDPPLPVFIYKLP